MRPWLHAILRLLSPSLRVGSHEAPSLLFDMNRVFQTCVTRWLRRDHAHDRSMLITAEDRSCFFAKHDIEDGPAIYNIRPDLVIRREGQVVAIADAKWKRLGGGYGSLPDLGDAYQLFAYAGVFECGSLSLIYPWHSSAGSAGNRALRLPTIGNVRPRIKVVLVDVEKRSFLRNAVDT